MISNKIVYEINILKNTQIPIDLVNDNYDYVYDRSLLFGYVSQMYKKNKIIKGNPFDFLRISILENPKYKNYISENIENVEYINRTLKVAEILYQKFKKCWL